MTTAISGHSTNQQSRSPRRKADTYDLCLPDSVPIVSQPHHSYRGVGAVPLYSGLPGPAGTGQSTLQIIGARSSTDDTTFQLRRSGGETVTATRTLVRALSTAFVHLVPDRPTPLGASDVVAGGDQTSTCLAAVPHG